MVEDRFNHWCSVWANEFAIRHPNDLSPEERSNLHDHASTCQDCAAALQQYLLCDALLRDYPFEEVFLAEDAVMIQVDGTVPPALEELWKEQSNKDVSNRGLREKSTDFALDRGNQRANTSIRGETIKPLPHNQAATSPIQSGSGICTIDLRFHCFSEKFAQLIAEDVEGTEAIVESIVGTALLEMFDAVFVDEVTISNSLETTAQEMEARYPNFVS